MTITEEFDMMLEQELAKFPITDDMPPEEVITMGILHIEIVELIGKALISINLMRLRYETVYR